MKKKKLHIFRERLREQIPPFPTAWVVDYLADPLARRTYGDAVHGLINIYHDDICIAAIDSENDYERFGKKLVKKFLRSPRYLPKLITWSQNRQNSLKSFLEKNLSSGKVRKIPDQKLGQLYITFSKKYRLFHLHNTPSWWIGSEAAHHELHTHLAENYSGSPDHLLSVLTEPLEYRSENLNEEIDFLKLAIRAKKLGVDSITIRKAIYRHSSTYGAIPFGYKTGVFWDRKYFEKKLKILLRKQKNPKKLIRAKLQEITERKKRRDAKLKKLQLPQNIQQLLKILRQLSYLQDLKKTTQTRSHPHLEMVVKPEIAQRLQLQKDDIELLSPREISQVFTHGITKKIRGEVEKRKGKAILMMHGVDNYTWLYGKKAAAYMSQHGLDVKVVEKQELHGSVACRGITKGTVRVCRRSTEILKVRKGDILVTTMTTPDFVPAMRKAGAIVTDEGGITSHAAIVSRELKKPCIIGTKIATKVLKDGDMVEVDAEKGIVRRIEKK